MKWVKNSCSFLVKISDSVIRQVIVIRNCWISMFGIIMLRFSMLISIMLMIDSIQGLELISLVQRQVCRVVVQELWERIFCSLKLMLVMLCNFCGFVVQFVVMFEYQCFGVVVFDLLQVDCLGCLLVLWIVQQGEDCL